MNHPTEKFVVLTGTMRSGTSLMGYLLQRTPDGHRAHDCFAFENDESRWMADLFACVMRSVAGTSGFGDPYIKLTLSGRVRGALANFLGVTTANVEDGLRASIGAEILRFCPAGPKPVMLGLKRTSMNSEIGILQDVFPGTRVIFMLRNPFDVVVSHCRRLNVDPVSGDGLLIVAYILANLAMVESMRAAGTPHLVIRYEDLVEDPWQVMVSVRSFLDLDEGNWSLDMLADQRIPNNSSFGATRGAGFGHGGGIRNRQAAKDAELGEVVTAFLAWLCRPVFLAFGYAEHQEKAPPLEEFRSLLLSMRHACARRRVSFAAVEARLRDLGFCLD